jgi:hypothetical protein
MHNSNAQWQPDENLKQFRRVSRFILKSYAKKNKADKKNRGDFKKPQSPISELQHSTANRCPQIHAAILTIAWK